MAKTLFDWRWSGVGLLAALLAVGVITAGQAQNEASSETAADTTLTSASAAPAVAAPAPATPSPADLKMMADSVWVFVAAMLVFFLNLGFACVESGVCR